MQRAPAASPPSPVPPQPEDSRTPSESRNAPGSSPRATTSVPDCPDSSNRKPPGPGPPPEQPGKRPNDSASQPDSQLRPQPQHTALHPKSGAQGQRKPLPGYPRQPSAPRLPHPLPPITALLQPPPQYPQAPPGSSPDQVPRPLSGHLAPSPSRPESCPPSRRPLPLMPPHDSHGRPSVLPTIPPLPSTTSTLDSSHNAALTEYAAARERTHQHRPFKCNVCSQRFSRNHDLKRHERIHVAAKPFQCDRCHKYFSRKDALKRHSLVKACVERKPGPPNPSPSPDPPETHESEDGGTKTKAYKVLEPTLKRHRSVTDFGPA
ncbi:transcriptional regulator of sulfur amino acid metabolism [Madurella fahalii]|uniref:Transcriptional regulator of sulfur amino acid metabolism n=1 Tax=Madurella fahalii TaxID=1157608 RepID=A0ABQ0GKK6_9PEZI